jgi:hypothetical protein
MAERKRCGYEVPQPFRTTRFCQQSARWLVHFTTPDDGKNMRTRTTVVRCFHHVESKFLPEGATQITTEAIP